MYFLCGGAPENDEFDRSIGLGVKLDNIGGEAGGVSASASSVEALGGAAVAAATAIPSWCSIGSNAALSSLTTINNCYLQRRNLYDTMVNALLV